jgi:vacuolar-type H+-ATPase subunit I/STV1
MLLRTLFLLALVTGFSVVAQAQKAERIPPPQPSKDGGNVDASTNRPDSKISVGSPEAEMLARAELKAAEKDYRENLERAREVAQLSTEIRDAYQLNKALGRIEEKKLERLEKLTRKIRSEAGGSDGEAVLEGVPAQLEPALTRLTEISDKMRKGVEKTPRQVVSAAVIERANELLEIIRYVRNFARSAKS